MKINGRTDHLILFIFLTLLAIGFLALSSASSDLAKTNHDDPYYYLSHQILYGLTLGVAGFLAGYFIPYQKYKKFAPLLLLATIGTAFLTFTPLGFSAGGATRWISLGFFTIQPAELLKIGFVIYLAAWLASERKKRQGDLMNGLVPFLMVSGFIALLLILQRSTSSIIIILFTALMMYFVSGAKIRYIVYALLVGALSIVLLIYFTPYRLERIMTFIDPGKDMQGSGYQINQALISIGSGGLFGVGYGNSLSKAYLPERIGDSIFAIIAEEFGFVGATFVILMFLFMVVRGFMLAKTVRDPFGKLLLVGFSTVIGVQVFMHIGAISGLIPLTGVPLPFISYGGTALAIFMTIVGIMLNVSRRA